MGRRAFLPVLLATAVTACATVEPPLPPPSLERIVYQPHSALICGSPCPVRIVTVTADGRAWVETGHWIDRENWRIDHREVVRIVPGAFGRVREALAPFRPDGDERASSSECLEVAYDVGGATVTWIDGTGSVERVVDFGCENEQAIAAAFGEIQLLLEHSY